MPCVTLLLTGVPHYVNLKDLSHYLDFIFNTDEIGSFRSRYLPNHPRTKQRQIALDFCSGFDAMAAQEKLDGYKYELNDGNLYTLSAKINKVKEYMRHDSFSPDRTMDDDQFSLSALDMIPDQSYGELSSENSKLDAQLELLKKRKLIVEAERELLIEKKRLKREYGCMHAHDLEYAAPKRYRSRSREPQPGPSRKYSSSRDRGSRESRSRSRSCTRLAEVEYHETSLRTRELRSHSKERPSKSRGIHSRDQCSKSRGPSDLTSLICSKRARSKSRERRSSSNERTYRDPSTSPERIYRRRRSISRERNYRKRKSRSRERSYRVHKSSSGERVHTDRRSTSGERDRERRSRENNYRVHRSSSRERVHRDRRSTSRTRRNHRHRERISRPRERRIQRFEFRNRGPISRERPRFVEVEVLSRSSRDLVVRKSRTPDRRPQLLAIMATSTEKSTTPRARSLNTPDSPSSSPTYNINIFRNKNENKYINNNEPVKNKQTTVENEQTTLISNRINETARNLSEGKNKHIKKNQEQKALTKFNSKIRKEDKLEEKVESISRDVMFLMLILLDKIMTLENIRISKTNQTLLDKTLHELVKERVEPLARVRKSSDVDVLRKYKLLYSKENDMLMLKKMLGDIPKTNESLEAFSSVKDAASLEVVDESTELQEHNTDGNHTEQNKDNGLMETECSGPHVPSTEAKETSKHPESNTFNNSKFLDITDVNSHGSKECTKNEENANNLARCERNDNLLRINEEIKELNEAIVTIDIDSPAKPVPKRPQFYLVIKTLLKDMMKVRVMKENNSSEHIQISDLQYALRRILTKLMKGQAYKPTREIVNMFRGLYPKDKDDQFIKDVIKDIKDGKYPELTGYPATTGDFDSEDDVILLENKYEVITLVDSDDDDSIEAQTKVITVDCETKSPTAKETYPAGSEVTGPVDLGTANSIFEPLGLAPNNPIDLEPSPGTSKHVPVSPGSGNLDSKYSFRPNPGPSVNPNPANFGSNDLTPDTPSLSRSGPAHPGSANNGSIGLRPAKPGTSKLVPTNPDISKLPLINPGFANSSPSDLAQVYPNSANFGSSKLTPPNPSVSRPGSIHSVSPNLGATGFRTANPGASKLVPPNPGTSMLRLDNPECAYPHPTYRRPVKPGAPNHRPANPVPVNSILSINSPVYPGISNVRPVDSDSFNFRPTNLRPVTHGITQFLPASLRPIVLRPANAGTSKIRSVNPGQAKTGLAKTVTQTMKKRGSQAQPEVTANTDEEDLKISDKGNENNPKTEIHKAENAKDPKDATERIEESNSNSLKVTAITIVTSLNELTEITDKTIDGPTMEVPIESIKEEIPLEKSDIEPTDPSLQPHQNPHVTSSTVRANTKDANGKTAIHKAENAKDTKDATERIEESNSNSLKVTAITIVTSLNELSEITDKTIDGPTMEVPIESIKEEIPFEKSDIEPTDPSLQPHQNPHVTSSTVRANTKDANGKTAIHKAENAKDTKDATERIEESNSNNLKVTAITIVTSLNEISAITDKTTDGPLMEVPIESFEEEIQSEKSDIETTDTTLQPHQNPKVTTSTVMANAEDANGNPINTVRTEENDSNSLKITAITIMTSLTELTAIANNERSTMEVPIEDIKEEIQDENLETEQNDFALELASNHDKSKEIINEIVNRDKEKAKRNNTVALDKNQITYSCGVGEQQRTFCEEGNGIHTEPTINEKEMLPQNNTASDDEDETIESIVKYVQSMI